MAKNVRCMFKSAQCHQDWTIHYWYRAIFSDETKSDQFQSNGYAWCWVRDGESQLQAHHVGQTLKHGGGAIYVWGYMTSLGMGYMCQVEGKMTQTPYLSILQDGVMKTIECYHFNPSRVILQHDNDHEHTAKLVNQWSSMQILDVLTWPPRSLHLNPIKHVWALVKRKLSEYPTPKESFNCGERVQASVIPSLLK